jgi:hypothetical protein
MEVTALIGERLTPNASTGVTDFSYKNVLPNAPAPLLLADAPPENMPEAKMNAGFTYEQPMGELCDLALWMDHSSQSSTADRLCADRTHAAEPHDPDVLRDRHRAPRLHANERRVARVPAFRQPVRQARGDQPLRAQWHCGRALQPPAKVRASLRPTFQCMIAHGPLTGADAPGLNVSQDTAAKPASWGGIDA